jgi:DNA-binding transcriptional regulator YiaG
MINLLHGIPLPTDIAVARKATGLTQSQAADAMGVSRTSWQSWESGRANMPLAAWALWQLAMGVHPLYGVHSI